MISEKISNKNNLNIWGLFFLIFTPLFLFAYFYTVPAEDSVILYEYAKNLAQSGAITYAGSQFPIEGATDFLWMVLIASLKFIGINEFLSALILNFLGLVALIYLFPKGRDRLLLLLAFVCTPYLYATLNGFSAISFCAIYVLALSLLLNRSKYLYLVLLILCLIRPDGVVWGAGCVLVRLLQLKSKDDAREEFNNLLKYLLIPGLGYFLWRYWYFGELLPIPFIVKSSSVKDFYIFYRASVFNVKIVIVPILIVLAIFSKNRKGSAIEFIFLFLIPAFFYSCVNQEQNIGNRFFAPFFFGGLYVISRLGSFKGLLLYVMMSIYLQFGVTKITFDNLLKSTSENVFSISKDLSGLKGSMLTTEAGRLAYYSNWKVEDSWGLNTPRFAHKLISAKDVSDGKYDLIVAHCDINLLKQSIARPYENLRSWDNQCKQIITFINSSNYEVYLSPYHSGGSKCGRYDIYAISPRYDQRVPLTKILLDHGAFLYSADVKADFDQICR